MHGVTYRPKTSCLRDAGRVFFANFLNTGVAIQQQVIMRWQMYHDETPAQWGLAERAVEFDEVGRSLARMPSAVRS